MALRDGQYKVVYRLPGRHGLPVINDQLLSGEGISPDQLMRKYVLPFTDNGYVNVKTSWALYVPNLFLDTANPWYLATKKCSFQEDGQKKSINFIGKRLTSTSLNKLRSILLLDRHRILLFKLLISMFGCLYPLLKWVK